MKKSIIFYIICIIIFSSTGYTLELRNKNEIEAGIDPFYGIAIGEFRQKFDNPFGFLLYGRGYYELNINRKINLYPEINLGWFYMSHQSESGRYLNFFPIYLKFMLDWKTMKIENQYGKFDFIPYLGFGGYLINYTSSRKNVWGPDYGYQMGLETVYKHDKLKNVFIQLGLEYFYVTEIEASLSALKFSLGAGYTFYTGERKEDDWNLKRNQYIRDLYGNDEQKIIPAARWLGRERVEEVTPRLVELLLKDERAGVRVSAAVALGMIRDEETLDPLTFAAAKDPDSDVRYSALLSISRITPAKKNMESIKQMKNTEKDAHILDYIKNMEEIFK